MTSFVYKWFPILFELPQVQMIFLWILCAKKKLIILMRSSPIKKCEEVISLWFSRFKRDLIISVVPVTHQKKVRNYVILLLDFLCKNRRSHDSCRFLPKKGRIWFCRGCPWTKTVSKSWYCWISFITIRQPSSPQKRSGVTRFCCDHLCAGKGRSILINQTKLPKRGQTISRGPGFAGIFVYKKVRRKSGKIWVGSKISRVGLAYPDSYIWVYLAVLFPLLLPLPSAIILCHINDKSESRHPVA